MAGMPPTCSEIAPALGLRSANSTEGHLRVLKRTGAIDLVLGASQGIRLNDTLLEQYDLPPMGRVAASAPILAREHIEARYEVDPYLFHS